MELNLSGEWRLSFDPSNQGYSQQWYLPDHFPSVNQAYHVPAFWFYKPFVDSSVAWLKKSFTYSPEANTAYYLIFFGSEKGKIYLNGELVGKLRKTAQKQTFEVSRFLQESNTLIIQLEDLTEQSLGIWKYIYLTEHTSVPTVAKKIISNSPSWLDSAVIYSIYTRSFSPEGNFRSVIDKLNYIRSTGANVVWFLPIHPIGKEARKGSLGCPYAIQDYYEINPEYGTKQDFKELVEKAHELGMKVIIDLVINHTSHDSVLFQKDPRCFKPQDIDNATRWGWTDVRELDYNYPLTREYILKVMEYWIKEFNIDGYRCDVAFLIPGDFWKQSISHIRSIKKDIIMLAEADNPELYEVGFDLTYDWMFMGLMQWVASGYLDYSEINEYVLAQNEYFPQNSRRLVFLENHDTQRAAQTIPKEKLPLFQLIRFFVPGVPLIYNGEELGSEITLNLFEKDPLAWNKTSPQIVEVFKTILKLKKKHVALNYHHPGFMEAGSFDQYYHIRRFFSNDSLDLVFHIISMQAGIIVNGKMLEINNGTL